MGDGNRLPSDNTLSSQKLERVVNVHKLTCILLTTYMADGNRLPLDNPSALILSKQKQKSRRIFKFK